MLIAVKIIWWTLLALLILIALALAVPTRLYVRYAEEITLQVRYLFLKINVPVTEEQKARQQSKKKKKKPKPSEKEEKTKKAEKGNKQDKKDKKKKSNPVVKWLRGLYKKGGVDAIIEAFKKIASLVGNVLKPIFRHIKLRSLKINVVVASDNAADTAVNYGRLCAGVYPALTVILSVVKYDDYTVNICPDFDKTALEPDISAEISLVPWAAVGGAIHALVRFIAFKIKGQL